jgi:zinc transport system ATP-binding protein
MLISNVVNFTNVRLCYDEVCAIRNINFTIPENTITAVIGPNGGGKSTILKLLSGLLKPDKGAVSIKKGYNVGYVSQFSDFDLTFPITVLEMVLSGTLCQKIKPFCRYTNDQKSKATDALKRVSLQGYEHRGINQLSGGELKRAVIARVLASDADIIVLDEPDSSLDVEAARDLYKVLLNIKKDKTILIASHHLNEVLGISDNVLYVMSDAKMFESPDEVLEKLKGGIII